MGGWRKHLELMAQSKLGLGSGVVVWAILAVVFAFATLGFLLLSAYVWLAQLLDPLPAALILTGFFLVLAIIAMASALMLRQRIKRDAQLALTTRRPVPWLDPMLLGTAVQVGRSLG